VNAETTAVTEIEIEVAFLSRDAGGRLTPLESLSTGSYRPHLRVCGAGEMLGVRFIDGPDQIVSGRQYRAKVSLMYGGVDYSPLKSGALFIVVEGPQIVGIGCVIRGTTDTQSPSRARVA
jgi:hypothetical protein